MNPEHCPGCGRPNHCAQSGKQQPVPDCWCFHTQISAQALNELPDEQRHRACLCPECATAQKPHQ